MMKKTISILLALCLSVIVPITAYAQTGFSDVGGYTETKNEYTFFTQDAVMVFKDQVIEPDQYEKGVWSGSDLYIPIGVWTEESEEETIATEKQIKSDEIEVSYKVLRGENSIDDVTIINPKKLKLEELPSGAYAKVEFADRYPKLQKSYVSLRLVLSAGGISYQNTRITFDCGFVNRTERIDRNSVYGAMVPSQFQTSDRYNGEVTFDFGNKIKYTTKVKPKKRYYLNLDQTPNAAVAQMYTQPHLEFYNFMDNLDSFASVGKLEIPINRSKFKSKTGSPQLYAYEIKDNTLYSLGKGDATFHAKTNRLTIHTQSLGEYVLSSHALLKTVDGGNENIFKAGYAESLDEVNAVPEKNSRRKTR